MVKNFILIIIALFLFILVFPFALVVTIYMYVTKKATNLNKYFLKIAISIDQLGNVVFKHFWNLALLKKGGHLFGDEDETISSVLGKNQIKDKLNIVGKMLAGLLDLIDKDHCKRSIEQ